MLSNALSPQVNRSQVVHDIVGRWRTPDATIVRVPVCGEERRAASDAGDSVVPSAQVRGPAVRPSTGCGQLCQQRRGQGGFRARRHDQMPARWRCQSEGRPLTLTPGSEPSPPLATADCNYVPAAQCRLWRHGAATSLSVGIYWYPKAAMTGRAVVDPVGVYSPSARAGSGVEVLPRPYEQGEPRVPCLPRGRGNEPLSAWLTYSLGREQHGARAQEAVACSEWRSVAVEREAGRDPLGCGSAAPARHGSHRPGIAGHPGGGPPGSGCRSCLRLDYGPRRRTPDHGAVRRAARRPTRRPGRATAGLGARHPGRRTAGPVA